MNKVQLIFLIKVRNYYKLLFIILIKGRVKDLNDYAYRRLDENIKNKKQIYIIQK